jgi:hypothetical protein
MEPEHCKTKKYWYEPDAAPLITLIGGAASSYLGIG